MEQPREYDATERCCGWCYVVGTKLQKCANCKRPYCSRECQISDWKKGYHKIWCGKAGEKGIDYEICPAGNNKGLGLFVKRDFQRGEKILVERSVMTREANGSITQDEIQKNPSVFKAAMALTPQGNGLMAKFVANCVALSDEGDRSGLFLNFSRVNHDCMGNSLHCFDPQCGLKLLVANHDIPAGSEVTFSYASNVPSDERAQKLCFRGFRCNCSACRCPETLKKLDRMLELDKRILDLGSSGRTEQAIRAGTALLKLYNEFQQSDMLYARTYYDLFQVAITKQNTARKGTDYIKKAYQHALTFYGREENETVRKYKQYVEDPGSHRNYLCLN